MKKYEIDDKAMKDGKLMENDIVLFRYADVLLMKSEAKVRDGRNGDEELNQVRTRVGAPERTATLDNLLAEPATFPPLCVIRLSRHPDS